MSRHWLTTTDGYRKTMSKTYDYCKSTKINKRLGYVAAEFLDSSVWR
ncbi:hypothetical protein PS893_01979 [Pseudomonas fluorescens]|nr:hypothetical protein PS893_01979 [Pseudomonas fluorescens]